MTIATSALVIGGGLAGAAVATHLATAGTRVILVEREAGPHDKVCGEFISGEAALYLRDLDLDPANLGAAEIDEIRLLLGERAVTARLPFSASSLSRRILDNALLAKAASRGTKIIRGQTIVALRREDRIWVATMDDGRTVSAPEVFLATGKHDLRGWKRPPGRQSDLLGFKLHWQLSDEETDALRRAVELVPFPGGYAGLELVERDIANLCLVVRRRDFFARGQSWEALFDSLMRSCPHLRRRLTNAERHWQRPLAISAMPYGFVQRKADGLWRLGDQAACISSFSGDGMSLALHSARLAAQYFLQGRDAEAFQARLAKDIAAQVGRATLLSQVLLQPLGQAVGMAAAQRVPALLSIIARATRIPPRRVSEARCSQM